jgi:Ca-activated chloride channel homolog
MIPLPPGVCSKPTTIEYRRTHSCSQLVCKLSICALLIGVARGQSPPQILLPVFALDHHGDPVSDLSLESLTISDNKTLVSSGAKLIRGADLPLRLGILIDTSNSQRNHDLYEPAVKGVKDFVNEAVRLGQDRVFFELFSAEVHATPLLTKVQLSGVSFALQVEGGTALYDAIALACTERIGKPDWQSPVRRVLVILSDGEDNASHITRAKAEAFPLTAGVVVFAISTNSSLRPLKGDNVLERLSKAAGGMAYADVNRRDIPKIFAQVRKQIDAMYYLTYVPPGGPVKDGARNVDVKPTKGVKLEIRAPRLYAWNP